MLQFTHPFLYHFLQMVFLGALVGTIRALYEWSKAKNAAANSP